MSWKQKFYKHYVQRSQHKKHVENSDFLELVDFFYSGHVGESSLVQTVADTNRAQLVKRITRSQIVPAIDNAGTFFTNINKQKLDSDDEDDQSRLRNFLSGAEFKQKLEEEQNDLNQVDKILGITAGTIDGENINPDELDERTEIARLAKLASVKNVLKVFGVTYNHLSKIKRFKPKPSTAEIVDVELGNNIPDLLGSETIKLVMPELEQLFKLGFVNEELLQWKKESVQEVGKGDVSFALDCSGSMVNAGSYFAGNYYNNHTIAAGVMLAMMRSLLDDGRNFAIYRFQFSTTKVGDSRDDTWPSIFRTVLNLGADGGTNIDHCLRTLFKDSDDDVVLLTDAGDSFHPKQIEELNQLRNDRRASTVLIGGFDTNVLEVMTSVIKFKDTDDMLKFSEEVL